MKVINNQHRLYHTRPECRPCLAVLGALSLAQGHYIITGFKGHCIISGFKGHCSITGLNSLYHWVQRSLQYHWVEQSISLGSKVIVPLFTYQSLSDQLFIDWNVDERRIHSLDLAFVCR